jgi:glycosyltransferase involved in cell wall biosynthesis
LGKNYLIERNPNVLKIWASEIEKKLNPETMVLTSYSSLPFAKLDTSKPKVFWADAVFANMVDYYKVYSNLCSESLKFGNQMEDEALRNATCAVYSSEWAANAAIKFYGVSPEKIKVVPYGANIDVNYTLQDIQNRAKCLSFEVCNLLFLGREWHRKGGDTAVAIAEQLNNRGIKTKLSIVGADPGKEFRNLDFVDVFGFIKKSEKKGRDLLNQLISDSHFLLLPSRADCTPIVINEMNAHGIPVITTNEGGIPSLISEGINGYMFDKDSSIELFADCIENIFTNRQKYIELSKSSFNEYQTRLNWDYSIQQFKKILEEVI